MRLFILGLACLLAGCASVSSPPSTDDTSLLVKRSSIWVPDLDRATVFFQDVIGFEIESRKTLDLDPGSVLFDLFNVDKDADIRRVLFSSPTQQRVLFVMESEGAPVFEANDKRASILVIRTDDMDGVIARAKRNGFSIGQTNASKSPTTGRTTTETTIFGPAGHAVLIYQTKPAQ